MHTPKKLIQCKLFACGLCIKQRNNIQILFKTLKFVNKLNKVNIKLLFFHILTIYKYQSASIISDDSDTVKNDWKIDGAFSLSSFHSVNGHGMVVSLSLANHHHQYWRFKIIRLIDKPAVRIVFICITSAIISHSQIINLIYCCTNWESQVKMSDLSEISDDESGTQVQNQRKEKGIKRSRELPNFDSEEDDDLQHDGLADSISSTVSVTFFKLSPFLSICVMFSG